MRLMLGLALGLVPASALSHPDPGVQIPILVSNTGALVASIVADANKRAG